MYKVLWFDIRDGYGIAIDESNNEYYIDSSCCPKDLKTKDLIYGIQWNPGLAQTTTCLREVVRK